MFPLDIYSRILPNLIEENKCGCNRVENIGLWIRIAQVSQHFQTWVFSAEGPFKLKKSITIPLTQYPKILRSFINTLNRERVALADAAFKYLESPDDHPENSALASVNPLVTNYQGESLLSFPISKMLKGENLEPVLKFFFHQVSPEQFLSPVKDCFCEHQKYMIRFFDIMGNDIAAKKAIQSILGDVFGRFITNVISYDDLLEWVQNKGIDFDVNALSCINLTESRFKEITAYFEKIIAFQPGILGERNSKGERLIHIILQMPSIDIKQFVVWIFNKYPSEIKAVDREGKSAVSYFFNRYGQLQKNCLKEMLSYITPEILWDVREELFSTLLQFIKKEKIKIDRIRLAHVGYFMDLLFHTERDLQQWLKAPYGADQKCFLDDLIATGSNEAYKLINKAAGDDPDFAEHLRSIAVLKGTDYKAIRELFPKYPGLKDQVHFNLSKDLSQHRALNELFDSNWATYVYEDGNTPLHYVFSQVPVSWSHWKMIVLSMIDQGFDPHFKNRDGKSVRDLAIENRWDRLLPLLS